jgi:hypothetical protein
MKHTFNFQRIFQTYVEHIKEKEISKHFYGRLKKMKICKVCENWQFWRSMVEL